MDTHYDGERRHSDTVSVNLEVANYTERKGLHMRDKIRSRVWKNPPETADIRNITSEEFNAWKCRPEDRKNDFRRTYETYDNNETEKIR